MAESYQERKVKVEIILSMDFPEEWDDNMINFYLNESSWCWSNIIPDLVEKGCICDICEGEVLPKK